MNKYTNCGVALLAAGSIGVSGCSNLTPGENAALSGGIVGLAVGIPLAAAGVDSRIAVPVTIGAAALAAGTAYLYAKHEADKEQRRIAEARARLYLAQRAERQRKDEEAAASRAATASASKKKSAPKTEPRYIAVETEQRDGYEGNSAVMVYDTESERLVGNDVYDVKKSKVGSVAKYDSVKAEYVGKGT